jgi:hypothetical protein
VKATALATKNSPTMEGSALRRRESAVSASSAKTVPGNPAPPDEQPKKVAPASLYCLSGALHQPFSKVQPGE